MFFVRSIRKPLRLNIHFSKSNAIQSALIYAAGDTVASLLTNSSSYPRMLGIAFIAATLYTIEIPNYFRWINSKTESYKKYSAALRRAMYALLFFNPLWIARHLLFVQLFSGNISSVTWSLLDISMKSFLYNIPISLPVNYFIQNAIPLKHRFLASSFYSALMAVYYAMSEKWFQ